MRCRERERGSAILIVFLFAAFVAIMLYEEMPVMAFEAQRAKEQLLIDRGNEYKQAVKVYWTHFQGRFPPNIDALENTNNIRFLRHRYKDPLTGKDDWRLLHMAPGGLGLIDSKVNPLPTNTNQNGTNGTNGQSTFGGGNTSAGAFGGSSFGGSGFAGSGFGTQPTANNSNSISGPVGFAGSNLVPGAIPSGSPEPNNVGGPPVYSVPQRPPAIAANGSSVPNSNDPNYDPNDPKNFINPNGMSGLINPQQNPNGPPMANPGQPAQSPYPASPNQSSPNQRPNAVQQIYGMISNQGAPAQASPSAFNTQPGSPNNGGSSTFGSNNGTNNTLGGMFAGVASIAKGTGIKIVNDQHEYSKWEFWFNPQEANMGANGLAGAVQANPAANTNGFNSNPQAGGSSNTGSSFGNFGGAFNSNGGNTAPATPPNPQPQPQIQ
jgi:hypothetical protein